MITSNSTQAEMLVHMLRAVKNIADALEDYADADVYETSTPVCNEETGEVIAYTLYVKDMRDALSPIREELDALYNDVEGYV